MGGSGCNQTPLSAEPDGVDAGRRRDLEDAARLETGSHLQFCRPHGQCAVALPDEPLLLRHLKNQFKFL